MVAKIQDVIESFGRPQAPAKITRQPFDYDASHYRRLYNGANPDPSDLYSYAQVNEVSALFRDKIINAMVPA